MKSLAKITSCMLLLLMLFSCSKGKDKIILAKIDDRVITLERFETSYRNVSSQFLPKKSGFEGLREFLETMIRKETMAVKADELGYDKDPAVVEGLKAYKKMGLQAFYLKIKVADKVKVTEKDLRDYYNRIDVTLTIRQILVDTEDEAEEVYQLLKDGGDFETICKRYSKSPDADVGGRAMTAKFGRFAPEFQNHIFDLQIGEFSRPMPSAYGYFIIKVLKKERSKPRPFEEMREDLEKMARSYKEMELRNINSDKMRERVGFQWYDDNIKIVFEVLPPDRPLTNPPPRKDTPEPLLNFADTDLEKPLVTYKNKAITIKDFSDLYDRSSFFQRPRREYRLSGIKKYLMPFVMNELVADEMESSGIENEPEVMRVMNSKKEELMISRMYEDLIKQQIHISEREITDYYDNNLELFKVPEKRRFGVVLTGDRASAIEAYEKIKSGEDFTSVVLVYSIDKSTKGNDGETTFFSAGEQPELDEVGFALKKVGEVSEPFQTSRGWLILKLIERQRGKVLPMSEARVAVERSLQTLKSEDRLNAKLEEWKKDMNVEVFEENLRKANVKERTRDSET